MIKKGASDGLKQALRDYIEENIDSLDPRDIPELLY